MEFIRYIFLILILTCSTSIGWILSKGFQERLKELIYLDKIINIIQNKIKFTGKPLKLIFEEVSKIDKTSPITKIFKDISTNLTNMKIEESIEIAINNNKKYLSLKVEDINLIKSLGTILGKTDIEGQMSEINEFKILLKKQIEDAEVEQSKNSKMYKSLGTILGLVIVILLF